MGLQMIAQILPYLRDRAVAPVAVPRQLRARRVVRTRPSIPIVVEVAQGVERFLPARRCDVDHFAGLQLDPREKEVHVTTAVRIVVSDGCPQPAARWVQARVGQPFDTVEHLVDLRRRRLVFRRPGDDPVCVQLTFSGEKRVREPADLEGIAAQHLHRRPRLVGVIRLSK